MFHERNCFTPILPGIGKKKSVLFKNLSNFSRANVSSF